LGSIEKSRGHIFGRWLPILPEVGITGPQRHPNAVIHIPSMSNIIFSREMFQVRLGREPTTYGNTALYEQTQKKKEQQFVSKHSVVIISDDCNMLTFQ
jgi:hypothetical protein